jgi:endo-1,3-1,4-beta-glycanase ExoK
MMNLWAGVGVDEWLEPFTYPGEPIYARYDRIEFDPTGCAESS